MEHLPIFWHDLIPVVNQLPAHSFHALLAMAILVGWALRANRQLAAARAAGTHLVPDEGVTARNLAELLVGGIKGMIEGILGERGRPYIALFGTYFVFILTANLMGLT